MWSRVASRTTRTSPCLSRKPEINSGRQIWRPLQAWPAAKSPRLFCQLRDASSSPTVCCSIIQHHACLLIRRQCGRFEARPCDLVSVRCSSRPGFSCFGNWRSVAGRAVRRYSSNANRSLHGLGDASPCGRLACTTSSFGAARSSTGLAGRPLAATLPLPKAASPRSAASRGPARRDIDATGLMVTPGWVDVAHALRRSGDVGSAACALMLAWRDDRPFRKLAASALRR